MELGEPPGRDDGDCRAKTRSRGQCFYRLHLAVGYSKANTSPILKLFLSRIEELRAPMGQ